MKHNVIVVSRSQPSIFLSDDLEAIGFFVLILETTLGRVLILVVVGKVHPAAVFVWGSVKLDLGQPCYQPSV